MMRMPDSQRYSRWSRAGGAIVTNESGPAMLETSRPRTHLVGDGS